MTEKSPASSIHNEQTLAEQTVTATDSSAPSQLDTLPPLEISKSAPAPKDEEEATTGLPDKRPADGGPEGMSEGEATKRADEKRTLTQKPLVCSLVFEVLKTALARSEIVSSKYSTKKKFKVTV